MWLKWLCAQIRRTVGLYLNIQAEPAISGTAEHWRCKLIRKHCCSSLNYLKAVIMAFVHVGGLSTCFFFFFFLLTSFGAACFPDHLFLSSFNFSCKTKGKKRRCSSPFIVRSLVGSCDIFLLSWLFTCKYLIVLNVTEAFHHSLKVV